MDDILIRLRYAVRRCDHDWHLGDEWAPAPTTCSDCERQKQAADEIQRLRAALLLAVGQLSTYDNHRLIPPDQFYEHFLKEASRV